MHGKIEDTGIGGTAQSPGLRAASSRDFEYFFGLYRDSLSPYFEKTLGWDEKFRRAAFRLDYPIIRCQAILAEQDGTPCGVLVLDPRDKTYVEIALLLIDPKYRNLGIGTQVLLGVGKAASLAGLAVRLQTFKLNEGAAKLYRCLGFDVVGEDQHYLFFRRSA